MTPDLTAAVSLLQESQAALDAAKAATREAFVAHMAAQQAEQAADAAFADAQRQFLVALRENAVEPVKVRRKAG